MAKRILVVAAHPDDEVLGCGATLARLAGEGHECHVLILAEGMTSRDGMPEDGWKARLQALHDGAREAGRILGARSVELLGFPDNRMDTVPLLDVVKAVEAKLSAIKPDILFTHHAGDLNIDHAVTARAVETAARPKGGAVVAEVYSWETLSSTEWAFSRPSEAFFPNTFFAVADTLALKLEAMRAYAGEMGEFPHPRSRTAIEALARLRGSQSGLEAAEAFTLLRGIR